MTMPTFALIWHITSIVAIQRMRSISGDTTFTRGVVTLHTRYQVMIREPLNLPTTPSLLSSPNTVATLYNLDSSPKSKQYMVKT
jgi:hypothetical protein